MAFDKNTMFFDTDSAVTETTSSSVMDFHGPDLTELTYRIVVNGTVSGTTPQMVVKLVTGDVAGTVNTEEKTLATITGAGETLVKYRALKRFRKITLTVSGTSPSFGHVEVGIDSGSRGKIR